MKKLFLSLLAIVICLSLTTGCDSKMENNSNDNNTNNTEEKNNNKLTSISDFEKEIKTLGISYKKTEMVASYIGAESGIKLTADDKVIEIYKYDITTDEYKTAESNQQITITGVGNYDAIVKNGYALLIDDDFPKYNFIIEIFNKLK